MLRIRIILSLLSDQGFLRTNFYFAIKKDPASLFETENDPHQMIRIRSTDYKKMHEYISWSRPTESWEESLHNSK